MQTPGAGTAGDAVDAAVAELVSGGSLEVSADRLEDADALASALPAGTTVYVNHLPGRTLAGSLPMLERLHAAGLEPVPHVAARRVASRSELQDFLGHAVRANGIRKVLLVGGDDPKVAGPWADSVALLADGALAGCGLREVGLAGYPEGHPRIAAAALAGALAEKLHLAAAQGLGASVVTQFSFAPSRVLEYVGSLADLYPDLPVYVGIAGPTEPAALLRYARRCGVSASLRALRDQGLGIVRLVTHTDPLEQVVALARYRLGRSRCNVVGTHFFSFGGVKATAAWMGRAIARR